MTQVLIHWELIILQGLIPKALKMKEIRARKYERRNKGIALILALFSMLFISLIVVAFLDIATIDQLIATNQIRDAQTTYIVDAGIEYKIYQIRWLPPRIWRRTLNAEFPAGSGNTYSVSVDASGFPVVILTSVGTVGDFQRTIEVGVAASGTPLSYTVIIDYWKEI